MTGNARTHTKTLIIAELVATAALAVSFVIGGPANVMATRIFVTEAAHRFFRISITAVRAAMFAEERIHVSAECVLRRAILAPIAIGTL